MSGGPGAGTGPGTGRDHERIEELIAGYALRSLSEEDAAEADRLLADHVPGCITCRRTVSDFQELSGELALAADPIPPPDLVLGRIHRSMDEVLSGGAPGRGGFVALAVGVVALVAMGGLSFMMASRASEAEDERRAAFRLFDAMSSPGVDPVTVDAQGVTPEDTGFLEVSRPDIRRVFLVSSRCPEPAPGHAYQLWLGHDGEFEPVGRMFEPDDGFVLLELEVDVARYDEIWITEETAGGAPASPNVDGHSWRAPLV